MFVLRIKLDGETIHIQAKLLDEKNMYTTVQILYKEIELNQPFYIPDADTTDQNINFGYYAVKRRLKLKWNSFFC